jgi:hypothetical protein
LTACPTPGWVRAHDSRHPAHPDYTTKGDGDKMSGDTYTLDQLAQAAAGGNLRAMAKMINDAGADPRLDEIDPTPSAQVARGTVIDLLALRAGDRVGRKLGELLGRS